MENKWKELVELLQSDQAITQVVHWTKFRDGQSCAKRAHVVRQLRHKGWSAKEIAEVLGRPVRSIWRLALSNVTQTNTTTLDQTSQSVQSYSDSTENRRTK